MKTQCTKHPKYKGKKKPEYKTPCSECLAIYLDRIKVQAPTPPPNKVIPSKKDKSKSRKVKHKKDYKKDLD